MLAPMKMVHLGFCLSVFGLFVACGVACGGEAQPAASPSQTTGSEPKEGEHAGHHEEHGQLSPALKDFHGVIAPVWHSDAGAVRVEKTCSSAKSIQDKAQATGDAALIAAAGALDPACAAPGRPDVEAKLTAVHERFHALAEKKQ
jgi:hypothetical protein